MKKLKQQIRNINKKSIILIVIGMVVLITSIFLAVSYTMEKQRYERAEMNTSALVIATKEYELDNKKHELKVGDFVLPDEYAMCDDIDYHIHSQEDIVPVEREFVAEQPIVFEANEVKIETYTIRTIVVQNKIWNEFKTIDTEITISCIDKTEPNWDKSIETITVQEGEQINLLDYFSASDLSGVVNITTDAEVDTTKIGSQTINVFATDKNGCVSNKTVVVVVEAKEKVEETTTQSTPEPETTTKPQTSSGGSNTQSNNNQKPNTSSKPETTTKKPETTTKPQTTSHYCGKAGNCGRWFNSEDELYNYWRNWFAQNNGGRAGYYNGWSCSCGRWTADFLFY